MYEGRLLKELISQFMHSTNIFIYNESMCMIRNINKNDSDCKCYEIISQYGHFSIVYADMTSSSITVIIGNQKKKNRFLISEENGNHIIYFPSDATIKDLVYDLSSIYPYITLCDLDGDEIPNSKFMAYLNNNIISIIAHSIEDKAIKVQIDPGYNKKRKYH